MASNLISTSELRKSSVKLMQDNVNNLWMWLAGMAVIQFVLLFWVTTQVSYAGSGMMMGAPAMGGLYFPLLIVAVVGSFLVTIGLMRALLEKAMPSGTKILGFWMAAIETLIAGIIIGVLCGIGFLVFILPGIWLAISFMFSTFEILANGKGIWDGIVSSFKLVKGRWWGVFGRFMMAVLWIILIEIVGAIVIGIVSFIISAIGLAAASAAISDLLRAAMAVFIAYFTLCWNVNLYRSLKAVPVVAPAPAPVAKS